MLTKKEVKYIHNLVDCYFKEQYINEVGGKDNIIDILNNILIEPPYSEEGILNMFEDIPEGKEELYSKESLSYLNKRIGDYK